MSATVNSHRRLARQACVLCHTQKRKCSRHIPQCDLCLKRGSQCQYPSERRDSLMSSDNVSNNSLPVLFFLDTWLFRNRGLSMTIPYSRIPMEFLAVANSGPDSIDQHLEQYFTLVHPFFPILSKMRTYQLCLSESWEGTNMDPGVILLMLSIRLLSIASSQGPSGTGELYTQVKHCYFSIESQGIITPRVLQAVVLMTYYEIGSGIYPAAFLSVGLCARLGHALGIHRRREAPQMYPSSASWVEVEELRRVWWGVRILDRYVTIGLIDRPFSCEDAHPEDLLPTMESSWDQGEPSPSPSLAVSGDASHAISSFARLCQASDLLSRVLRHVNEKPSDIHFWYKEGIRLHHLLDAFATGLTLQSSSQIEPSGTAIVDSSIYPAMGVVYSAQMLLYDMHTCAEFDDLSGVGTPEQLEMQAIALACIKVVCPTVSNFSREIRPGVTVRDASISPLVINSLYEAAKYYFWRYREANKPELLHEVTEITLTLQAIAHTWAVAGMVLMAYSPSLRYAIFNCGNAHDAKLVADKYLSILNDEEFRPRATP